MRKFVSMCLVAGAAIASLSPIVASAGALVPDSPTEYRSDPAPSTPTPTPSDLGAPAPLIGAGLPLFALIGGGYLLVRRLRRKD